MREHEAIAVLDIPHEVVRQLAHVRLELTIVIPAHVRDEESLANLEKVERAPPFRMEQIGMVLDEGYNLVLRPTQFVQADVERAEDLGELSLLDQFKDFERSLGLRFARNVRAPAGEVSVKVAGEHRLCRDNGPLTVRGIECVRGDATNEGIANLVDNLLEDVGHFLQIAPAIQEKLADTGPQLEQPFPHVPVFVVDVITHDLTLSKIYSLLTSNKPRCRV